MSDSENLTPRQQRAAERLLEDEGLTGGLTDEPASRLVRWAGEAAVRAAADEHSDEKTAMLLGAIRQAARQAARQADSEGKDVVDLAQQVLGAAAPELIAAPAAPETPSPAPETPSPAPEPQPAAPDPQPAPEPQPAAPDPQPAGLRRRLESLRVRLISLISHRTQ